MEYPENAAIKVWRKGDLTFSVVKQPMGHYCGYVRFPRRPVRETAYGGILTYVPVHGGITYAKQSKDGSMVYGFDCAHSGDWTKVWPFGKKWTLEEVVKETEKMAIGIQIAAKYESRYLRCRSNECRAKVLNEYHEELKKYGIEFDLRDNLGALLRVLFGKL